MSKRRSLSDNATVPKTLGQRVSILHGEPTADYVRDGKILGIRTHHVEDKCTKDEIRPWGAEKDGKLLKFPISSRLATH